jgi:hypothetical protein
VKLLTKATLWPSGEKTPAPEVPLKSTASGASSRRRSSRRWPFAKPTIAIVFPSGEIAIPP